MAIDTKVRYVNGEPEVHYTTNYKKPCSNSKNKIHPEKIIWDDAGGFAFDDKTWHTIDDVKESYSLGQFINTTYGWVVYENKESVIVAQSVAHNDKTHHDEYAQLLRIPHKMVIERIKL